MRNSESIIVVGAGISGLTAAFRLQQRGFSVRVLEASNDVGGRMTTLRRDGFCLDLVASILPTSYRCLLQLIEDAGLSGEVLPTSDSIGVMRAGRIHRSRSSSAMDNIKSGLLSWGSKVVLMRAIIDAMRAADGLKLESLENAARIDTESAADYARRRLNDELLEYLVGPVCRTFYLAPPEQVSVVNFLFFLRNSIGASFFNSQTGIDFLPKGLARGLDIVLGASVSSVQERAGEVEVVWEVDGKVSKEIASGCIIALPAPQMLSIHPGIEPERREIASSLQYPQAIGVQFALASRPASEDAMAIQIPHSEHPDMVAVVLEHNKAPGRAPAGKGLVSTVWQSDWALRQWERDDAEIATVAETEFRKLFPWPSAEIQFAHVHRSQIGPDVSAPGAYQRIAKYRQSLNTNSRIRLAGDYCMSSSSTNAAAWSGQAAANELAQIFER